MCSNGGVGLEATSSFPNPAQDYYFGPVSLDRRFITHPASTFMLRVHGAGLKGHGIFPGDVVLVDRALNARPGLGIIAIVDGQYRMGWWTTLNGRAHLTTDLEAIPLRSQDRAWGVIIATVHDFLRP